MPPVLLVVRCMSPLRRVIITLKFACSLIVKLFTVVRLVFPFLQKAFNALGFRDRADVAGLAFIGASRFVGTQPQQPYSFF